VKLIDAGLRISGQFPPYGRYRLYKSWVNKDDKGSLGRGDIFGYTIEFNHVYYGGDFEASCLLSEWKD
jgi:hypothetical protein